MFSLESFYPGVLYDIEGSHPRGTRPSFIVRYFLLGIPKLDVLKSSLNTRSQSDFPDRLAQTGARFYTSLSHATLDRFSYLIISFVIYPNFIMNILSLFQGISVSGISRVILSIISSVVMVFWHVRCQSKEALAMRSIRKTMELPLHAYLRGGHCILSSTLL